MLCAIPDEIKATYRKKITDNTEVDNETGCWVWKRAISSTGYGSISLTFDGSVKATTGHRLSWLVFRGDVADGLVIDHLCRNRACVNPDHLEPVTQMENAHRGANALSNRDKYEFKPFSHNRKFCANGHAWTKENVYEMTNATGHTIRKCRICVRVLRRKRQLRIGEST